MQKQFLLLISSILILFSCQNSTPKVEENQENKGLKAGIWRASLALHENVELPFNFELTEAGAIIIHNAEEHLKVTDIRIEGDEVKIIMPVFATYFKAKIKGDTLEGVWVNPNKTDYEIPFTAIHGRDDRFPIPAMRESIDLTGQWKVDFSPNTEDTYPAIGLFQQEKQILTGTFLTETGDYRYLEGVAGSESLSLSCFDGAHAFLFTADIEAGNIKNGVFYSGKHWQEPWQAERNDSFKLADMDTLTYLKEGYDQLEFAFADENGDTVRLTDERFKGKVVIVQIMGTWCPNCMDETIYFVELYKKYKDQGLEIIAIDYELKNEFETFQQNIKRMKEDLGVEYISLFGGPAKKSEAIKTLPMLNHILSYPTAIYIDRNGEIQKIQTGFSGPGTGEIYDKYVERTNKLVEQLLK
jgi:thiol-disulfide isomerase/thioredoxin